MAFEIERALIQRHVREAEGHVERQREIISGLPATGGVTEMAQRLLREFEERLRQHRAHLERVTKAK
jgi:hypothetical protein